MELLADGLLIAAAFTATLYCVILSRRLSALTQLDRGLGGAIAGLSERIELTRASLAETRSSTGDLTRELSALTARAEIAAGRLELLLATVHENDRTTAESGRKTGQRRAMRPVESNAGPATPAAPKAQKAENTDQNASGQMMTALRKIAAHR